MSQAALDGEASARCAALINASELELVRFVWCDTHGQTRGKTLTRQAAIRALRDDIDDYEVGDFEVQRYQCHETIPMAMRQ